MQGKGFLAIRSDINPKLETDYLHWLTREHASERVNTKGFIAVRVFHASLVDIRRYLIVYELEGPEVLNSEVYLSKLNNPSPWSQRIMPVLSNFTRGGGRLLASAGTGESSFLAAIMVAEIPLDFSAIVVDLAKGDRISAVRLFETDRDRTSIQTREKDLRKDDRSFGGLFLIEGLNEASVADAVNRLASLAPDLLLAPALGTPFYRQIYSLDRRALSST